MELGEIKAHLLDVRDFLPLEPIEVGLDRLRSELEVGSESLERLVQLITASAPPSANDQSTGGRTSLIDSLVLPIEFLLVDSGSTSTIPWNV